MQICDRCKAQRGRSWLTPPHVDLALQGRLPTQGTGVDGPVFHRLFLCLACGTAWSVPDGEQGEVDRHAKWVVLASDASGTGSAG